MESTPSALKMVSANASYVSNKKDLSDRKLPPICGIESQSLSMSFPGKWVLIKEG